MTKVKVIEVEATKLDPNATYLIVFNKLDLRAEQTEHVVNGLKKIGVKNFVATYAANPETALKVYQIPHPKDSKAKK